METVVCRRIHATLFLCCSFLLISHSVEAIVRGVNLGGWLVVEGWIKFALFDDIPNGDMIDGTRVQFKSVKLKRYVGAENGGGGNVTVNKQVPTSSETFRLWRVSEVAFQFRTSGGQFLSCAGEGGSVSAAAKSPSRTETFYIERNYNQIHIRSPDGAYLQARSSGQLTADYPGKPGWDKNAATFDLIVESTDFHGEYQITNGYGREKATEVLTIHRRSFVTVEDFKFLAKVGINTVKIPVGWWIAQDPNPPPPFIGGSLEALDNAFTWARDYNIKCIIELHAAPGSQNGVETSATRDGSAEWATSEEYISQTLDVIDFLASRYAKHPALLGIELLNNPSSSAVPLNILVSYYSKGYQIVRKYSSTAYVIICQRSGNADPMELFQANIGSSNLVVDIHYFNRDKLSANSSISDNIELVEKTRRAEIEAMNNANGPLVFVGEWVNEMPFTNGSSSDYQKLGKAQVEVYSTASFGWAYWTLKNKLKHWDFEWNINNNYLQLDAGDAPSKRLSRHHIMLVALLWGYYLFHHMS